MSFLAKSTVLTCFVANSSLMAGSLAASFWSAASMSPKRAGVLLEELLVTASTLKASSICASVGGCSVS
ncbi:MAG: hypothetical protein M0C28_24750 [Candidatus Moduliflexus flocculans]|nr:hypothetical protein [Candidatus Moduliflexus flocculans]